MASGPITSLEEIEIRPAEADDAATIRDLLGDLARTLGDEDRFRSTADDILRYGFGAARHFEALIAERRGRAVGLVLFFRTFSTWRGRPGVYVQDLHVTDRCRGQGLGRRLLAAAARHARSAGCTHLRLSVDPDNTSALAFYRRLGLDVRGDEFICQVADAAFDLLAGDAR